MNISIAHLGPAGTYAEIAALAFSRWLAQQEPEATLTLQPYATIDRAIRATAQGETQWAVIPVENSIEGSVSLTLDTIWQTPNLHVQKALVLPIAHGFLSHVSDLSQVKVVYSHPQGLAQCYQWLTEHVPEADYVPINSTAEAARLVSERRDSGAIASLRAAELYQVPVLAHPINDHPDNCTRFWVVSPDIPAKGTHTALVFSTFVNRPGSLLKSLQLFADQQINMSRIESRPTKRSLGDYWFFVDLEMGLQEPALQKVLASMEATAENLRVLGTYEFLPLS